VSRENRRLLTVSNDSSRSVSRENRRLLTVDNESRSGSSWKDFVWKDLIFASLFWKHLVSARIRLFYLSENDLSENDYDLLWISEILLFSSRYYQILEISRISAIFHLSSFLFIKNWFFSTRRAVTRSLISDLVRTEKDWRDLLFSET
jgi:hypothetical protein